ncbi:hypothetical protein ACWEIM_15475 [Streptomyces sp. NPDC004778]
MYVANAVQVGGLVSGDADDPALQRSRLSELGERGAGGGGGELGLTGRGGKGLGLGRYTPGARVSWSFPPWDAQTKRIAAIYLRVS